MITIRPIHENDAASFLALCTRLDQETEFMMLEPGERTSTIEAQAERIRSTLAQPNQIILVAEDGGTLVGYIGVYGGGYHRNRHNDYIVIGILQAYAGQGLGTRLFQEAEAWARTCGITRLELTVMAHNTRGVALYQKMGFQIEGTLKHHLKVDGRYVDEYHMGKLLDEA